MSSISCIIFDFDNTLVKSHIDFPKMKVSMARIVRQYGLDFGAEEEIPHKYTAGAILDKVAIFDKENGTNLTNDLWAVVEECEREGMENISIAQDVFSMLSFLEEKNIRKAILTNNSKQPTLEVLERFNILGAFEQVIAREDVHRMKPDPEGLLLLLQELDLSPESVIFIGDSWVDGLAANKAEIRFILFRDEDLDPEKHQVVVWKRLSSMSELVELLENGLS